MKKKGKGHKQLDRLVKRDFKRVEKRPRLPMSESEICGMYRGAADKNAQIGILAQLNSTSTDVILSILADNDYIPDLPADKPEPEAIEEKEPVPAEETETKTVRHRRAGTAEKIERMAALADAGMTAKEAAGAMGTSVDSVYRFAKAHGICFTDGRKGKTKAAPASAIAEAAPAEAVGESTTLQDITPAPDLQDPCESVQPAETPETAPACGGRSDKLPAGVILYEDNIAAICSAVCEISRRAKETRSAVIDERSGLAGVRVERLGCAVQELYMALRAAMGEEPK